MSLSLAVPHNTIDRISFTSSEDAGLLAFPASDTRPEITRKTEAAPQATTRRQRPSLLTALLRALAAWPC